MDRQVPCHPEVRDDHPCPELPSQYVDGSAPPQEVEDHLARHFLGVGAHPFLSDSMVTGQREDNGISEWGIKATGYPGQLDAELLEQAKAARRLG
jgi:hypothetical protein